MRRRDAMLLLAGAVAACAAPPQPLLLPPQARRLAADPLEAALRGAADAFSYPGRLQGQPARAAIAVAQLEYLAVEIPAGRSTRDLGGIIGPALQAARYEVRQYAGIAPDAPPQAVIDALMAAATAPGGDAAAPAQLPGNLFPAGGAETWRRLAAMPRLPQANTATVTALRHWEFGPPESFDMTGLHLRLR